MLSRVLEIEDSDASILSSRQLSCQIIGEMCGARLLAEFDDFGGLESGDPAFALDEDPVEEDFFGAAAHAGMDPEAEEREVEAGVEAFQRCRSGVNTPEICEARLRRNYFDSGFVFAFSFLVRQTQVYGRFNASFKVHFCKSNDAHVMIETLKLSLLVFGPLVRRRQLTAIGFWVGQIQISPPLHQLLSVPVHLSWYSTSEGYDGRSHGEDHQWRPFSENREDNPKGDQCLQVMACAEVELILSPSDVRAAVLTSVFDYVVDCEVSQSRFDLTILVVIGPDIFNPCLVEAEVGSTQPVVIFGTDIEGHSSVMLVGIGGFWRI